MSMTSTTGGEILWEPPADVMSTSRVGQFLAWLREHRGLDFATYEELWRWSVTDLEGFWGSVAEHLGVRFHDRPTAALEHRTMPGARWFPGGTLNFAEHALGGADEDVVFVARSEARARVEMTRGQLRSQVASVRAALQRVGVGPGDRVAAYLPNIPEALVALYATASLGAVFTSCAPESGTTAVLLKVGQVEPTVLITVDGYVYGGRPYSRVDEVAAIRAAVPSIRTTILVPYLSTDPGRIPDALDWNDLLAEPAPLEFTPVPFDHPLYIVYSSGTTGRPKAIVHGHGGILLEHLKLFILHDDLRPSDRWFWYSSTNWMAWNYSASALLPGGSVLMYDGHPMRPSLAEYWQMVGEERVTWLGISPAFIGACQKAGVVPREVADLSALRAVNAGGSPLSPEGWRWVYRAVSPDVYLSSSSGGTDVASSFVSGTRLLPVRAGEIACRLLGVDAQAYDENGEVLDEQRGELVIREPMPSMPLRFWGDDDGHLMFDSYFARFPGVWCHGDWVTFSGHGSCAVTGRSDATLNRGGVRLGTSEFYAVIDDVDDVIDSLVVHLEDEEDGAGELLLFLQLREGRTLTLEMRDGIASLLRRELSPRHVPDLIHQVHAIPRTLSGKRQEIPVKRLLLDPDSTSTIAGGPGDADTLGEFREFSRARAERLRHS